jgi:hypothetical protein
MNTGDRSSGSRDSGAMPNEQASTNGVDTPISRLYTAAKQEVAAKAEPSPAADMPSSARQMLEALIADPDRSDGITSAVQGV